MCISVIATWHTCIVSLNRIWSSTMYLGQTGHRYMVSLLLFIVIKDKMQIFGYALINLDDQTFTVFYKDGATPLEEEKIKEMVYWAGYDFVGIKEN